MNMVIEDHGNYVSVLLLLHRPIDLSDHWKLSEVCRQIQELAIQYENSEGLGSILLEDDPSHLKPKLRN